MEETPPPPTSFVQEDGNEVSSSSSLVEINPSPSPMENSVIVRLLLEYCINDVKSLQTFALVSHAWYDATRPRWNALVGTLRLYPSEEQRNHENEDKMKIREKIMSLEEFFCKSSKRGNIFQKYPYHKYELRYWDLQPSRFEIENALNAAQPLIDAETWFWSSNRLTFIAYLNMHHCTVPSGTFTMYSEEFIRAFPNLKALKILGADISTEAMNEIVRRYSEKSDYYEHPNLRKVHLEPLFPMAKAYRALTVFNRSMTSMKSLYVRELREEDPNHEYKIADFSPGHFHDLHQIVRNRAFDTLDVVEYTSTNPEYRAFRNYPVHSRDGISSFPGTFEVFSGIMQKVNVLSDEDEPFACDVRFKLDMYACPFSTSPETHACWDNRLNKIALWGGFACSLGFLRGMRHLEELTYNTSCFGNEVHRRKVLKFLEEDSEGTFHDKNPYGGGTQLQIKWDEISEWARGTERFLDGGYRRPHFATCLSPSSLTKDQAEQGQHFMMIDSSPMTLSPRSPDKNQAIGRNLKKLDIDFRFGEATSWRSLAEAFPNVLELKGVIQGDEQLRMIGNNWPRLTRLVVGHGSKQLSLEMILKVVTILRHLKEFEWKGCACLGVLASPQYKLTIKQRRLERKFATMGVKFTLPWRRQREGICLEKVFDDAMRSGRISNSNLELLLSM